MSKSKPPQTLLLPEQLAGVREKLKRADETIKNLNSEIVTFLNERPKTGFSKDKQKAAQEFVEFYTKRGIPPRFGVLAGEVAHHLRSSLDHVAWMLSDDDYRTRHERWVSFPIAKVKPTTEKELTAYGRQIKGISAKNAVALIDRLQPHHATNATNNPLSILHDLDRKNKHQTLALIVCAWNANVTLKFSTFSTFMIGGGDSLDKQMEREGFSRLPLAPKSELEFSPYVAFDQIGGWKGEAVVPALTHLLSEIARIVDSFAVLTV